LSVAARCCAIFILPPVFTAQSIPHLPDSTGRLTASYAVDEFSPG
jgi:hypothetical protein